MNSTTETTPHQKKKQAGSFFGLGLLAGFLLLAILTLALGVKIHHRNAQVADLQKQLTQAKSEITQSQAELDKDKAQTADLQSQVDKEKVTATEQQSSLDLSKYASAQLQAQLDKEKTQSTDLQLQVDKDKAQTADLQTQLNQAASGSAQLLTQLDQAKIQSLDLEARLQTAENDITQLQPLLLKTRHMPVTTSFEKVHGDRSFTLHINNLYLQPVNVDVTITSPEKTRSQPYIIGGGATLNLAKLAAGENVVIASTGYDPVNLTVQ